MKKADPPHSGPTEKVFTKPFSAKELFYEYVNNQVAWEHCYQKVFYIVNMKCAL